MNRVPRAAITAVTLAETAQFFSFGTTDLTHMPFVLFNATTPALLPEYVKKKSLSATRPEPDIGA